MDATLVCWKCGGSLAGVLLPLSQRAACPSCEADLHVCRMCTMYDTSVAKGCREAVAPEVRAKERANFCDYLVLRGGAHDAAAEAKADAARAKLEAMFGVAAGEGAASQAEREQARTDAAREELNRLFGLGEDESKR